MSEKINETKFILIFFWICLFTIIASPVITAVTSTTWPKVIKTQKGDITVYQPTPESLEGTKLSGRAAVSVKPTGSKQPVFGAIWMTTNLEVDRDSRIAVLDNITIPNIKFSDAVDSATRVSITKLLENEIPKWNLEVSMDDLIATLEDISVKSDSKFKNDPPEIIVANKPSVLVFIDGKPILKELKGYDFQKVENTPFFIVLDPKEKIYYMFGDKVWYSAPDIMGPWGQTEQLSSTLKKLQKEIEKSDNPQGTTGSSESDDKRPPENIPDIIVRTTPAELIVIDGEPELTPITATNMLYVKNTESDVFMDIQSQEYFILVSGRWYSSRSMSGPWKYTEADKLPGDFAKIPEGSEKDGVLASVAGTDASREAILDTQIPQTAEVDRKTATVKVEYDGEPKFENVEGTSMLYAVNSPQTVLKVSKKYYCVDNGIWFESASASGPWQVATSRPAEVDNIEPSSTVYNVKYVYIYDVTPEVVYVGYTPGYYGCYVYGPTVVYGTGYPYVPWYGSVYYPRPVTYGFSMRYNPYTGWGMSFGVSYGPVHISFGGRYYGGYWGPPMYRPPYHYHPPHGGYYPPHGGRPPSSGRPSQPGYGRPDRPPTSGSGRPEQMPARGPENRVSNNMYSNNRAGVNPNTSDRMAADRSNREPSVGNRPNNVYTDRNGNVYQQTNKGWEQRRDNKWQPTDKSSPSRTKDQSNRAAPSARPSTGNATPSQRPATRPSYNRNDLNRQSYNRNRGTARTSTSSSYSRSARPARSGGGGGRRR